MWANRITLDFIKHDDARAKIKSKLEDMGGSDEWIKDLHISCDGGYVYYKVILSNNEYFTIFDNGTEIK